MSRSCTITSKFHQSDFGDEKLRTLFVEDFVEPASVNKARILTDSVYKSNSSFVNKYDYKNYKITWAWYSEVFQFCIKYLEIESLIKEIKLLKVDNIVVKDIDSQYSKVLQTYFFDKNIDVLPEKNGVIFSKIEQFLFNTVMLFFSMLSILFFLIRPGRNIGTYTGDFVYKSSKSDFRLNHLYNKFEENNIRYVEFIRSTKIKIFFVNIVKRRRFAIYYTSLIYFINLFTRISTQPKPKDFYQSVLFKYYHDNIVLNRSVVVIEKILKVLKIDKFVIISFSSRSAPLSIAAKSSGIKTIGIMHGLQQKEDSVYEFMESYNHSNKIGCDKYGVWSPHYLAYFKKYSKISHTDDFEYSGLLRPVKNFCKKKFKRLNPEKVKVLLISEPSVSVDEIIPYIESLNKYNDIEIGIKIRPMYQDMFFEDLKKKLPIVNSYKVYDGKIEDAVKGYDVLLGSNSTAVIEASLYGKLSILLNTVKFGDYFEIDSLFPRQNLLVNNPESLHENILFRINNEDALDTIGKIRYNFFGDNKDGAEWIVKQL